MTLTLRAVSLNDNPLTQPITAHFDDQGGSIGRSDHNTLALPDPERHISRQHAEISAANGGYFIKNVGSANPIIVRGQPLARGESAPLMHRDQVRIGGYLLEVIDEGANDIEASTIARGRAAVDALTPGVQRAGGTLPPGGGLAPRSAPLGASGGLGDLGAPLSSSNPFADLLGDAAPQPAAPRAANVAPAPVRPPIAAPEPLLDPFSNRQPAPAGIPPSSPAWPPAANAPRQLLPADFDPFAEPAPPPAPERPAERHAAGAFDDLIPNVAPASIDQLIGPQRGDRDPLADFMADVKPRRPGGPDAEVGPGGVSTDPLAMFGGAPDAPTAMPGMSTPADNIPERRAAFVPPAVVPLRAAPPVAQPPQAAPRPAPPALPREADRLPPATPARAMPPAAAQREPAARAEPAQYPPIPSRAPAQDTWSGDPRELWSAFCDGAGVRLDPPQGLNPELMRIIGGLLRTSVEGALQLMTVRAATKHELRAQVTIIQARNNNPLKFSPDARSALEQMLQPPMRGFLSGPAAMTDAMHDLVGHTIGTMAGTRAALEGVLNRFTPRELEAKLVGKSVLDSLLPMNRKAKLWELYLQHFDAIRNEAHEDFHTLFGKAFLAAYEQQLDRLQREKTSET